jgi:sodium-dependent phosphate cotransporter
MTLNTTATGAGNGEVPITTAERMANLTRALIFLFVFMLGIKGLGDGFGLLGADLLEGFFLVTENPFLALMVGILTTSMVQSSSVTTALIVALVAAPENPLPVANAVPMIMGANFGTSVTNTIVALAHAGHKDEFKRAFAVSTCDDFFELCSLSVLFPLEIATGFIQRTAEYLAAGLAGTSGLDYHGPVKVALEFTWAQVHRLVDWALPIPEQALGGVLIIIAGACIYGGLISLVKLLRTGLKSKAAAAVNWALNRVALVGMMVGLVVTVIVQSSSVTTSLLVPLAGAGILTLEQAFPVVLGANLGTTMTALLAAMATTGPYAVAGLTIALVHFVYNMTGIIFIYSIPAVRKIPLALSRWVANLADKSVAWAIAFTALLFYGIPALVAYLSGMFS